MADIVPADPEPSTDDKALLTAGRDFWHTQPVDEAGLGSMRLSDGPNGVRGTQFWIGSTTASACFPCGAALGATWDPPLVGEIASAIGREAHRKGVHVLLGPTVNIPRLPTGGRNFECFSEDPLLSARLAVAYITGLQSHGVASAVKHFVANDTEAERMTVSSAVDERTLREIYLPPFEAAVREAGARAVMAAYNQLNGTFCTEHRWLLSDLLKTEWGFDGVVVSDWFGTHSTVASSLAGLDLEMPGPGMWLGSKLLDALRAGDVPDEVVGDQAGRMVALADWTGASRRALGPELSVDDPADRELARRAAAEATVLLQNRDDFLPLSMEGVKTLALVGPGAVSLAVQGGGSAQVSLHPVPALSEAVASLAGPGVEVSVEPGCTIHRRTPALDVRHLLQRSGEEQPVLVEFFDSEDPSGEPLSAKRTSAVHLMEMITSPDKPAGRRSVRVTATHVAPCAGRHRFTLSAGSCARLSLDGRELIVQSEPPGDPLAVLGGGDLQTVEVDLDAGFRSHLEVVVQYDPAMPVVALHVGYLPPQPEDLMERAVSLAARADAVIAVVGRTPEWESEGFDTATMTLPGRQDELVERVAAANPATAVVVNAGSPVSMPWATSVRSVLQVWFPGEEGATALADVILGLADPGGRLPVTIPERLEDSAAAGTYPPSDGEIEYAEGVFVGYRHHDTNDVPPAFCFGHGMSYTRFRYGPLVVSPPNDAGQVEASVAVANVGTRTGSEVVQLYVRDQVSDIPRPDKELKGFAKLRLAPGESREARFVLDQRAFAYWSAASRSWCVEPGAFDLLVGSSSRDIRATAKVVVEG